MKSLDLFSCIGCHAIGFERAGIETVGFYEINPWRRAWLRAHFPGAKIDDDVRYVNPTVEADIIVGGPPCQQTSVSAAIHGYRTGESLWAWMHKACLLICPDWVVVEQPPGNAAWETKVACDLHEDGWHVARFEFGACDIGAPYLRRRVFLVACTSLPRLEVARQTLPSAIESVKRAANARGDWNADQLAAIPVDARSANEFDRGPKSQKRKELIEALGDSNPPHMAEAIGRAIVAANRSPSSAEPTGK